MSFDNIPTGKLQTKVSSLIDGQLPDFIQADHPIFSRFLKHYYQYLESGELRLTVDIDNLLLELTAASNVLDVDGNKIVLESSDGKFTVGETITGGTSKATATVLVDDLDASTPRLFITSYPTLKCPPYESYYRNGIIYGESASEIMRIYEKYSLNIMLVLFMKEIIDIIEDSAVCNSFKIIC